MLPFVKMQAVGNDFVVIDVADTAKEDLSALARRACDRHFGIGADGLLALASSRYADLRMRIFNADGSEDTMCGNGLRCAVRRAFDRGQIPPQGVAETLAGRIPYAVLEDGDIRIDLGPPRFAPEAVPFSGALPDWADGAVNTGSPHTIRFVQELPGDGEFLARSPAFERDPAFPERTSVMWTIVEGANQLRLRIWERGVGETLGCGTGAAAAAVVARRLGKVAPEGEITVFSPGGKLRVVWGGAESDRTFLIGGASFIFQGVLE